MNDTEHFALLLRLYAFLNNYDHIELEYSEQAVHLCEEINAYFEERGLRVDYSDLAGIGLFLLKESERPE